MTETEVGRWPKPRRGENNTKRRWRVTYNLAYDGGGNHWDGHYRTRLGARLAIVWNRHVASWGGSAVLYDCSPRYRDNGGKRAW